MCTFMVCLLTLLQQMTRARRVHWSLAQESNLLPSHLSVSTRPATSARTMVGRARLPAEPAWPATGRAADRLSMSPGTLWVLDGLMLNVILMYEWMVKLCVCVAKLATRCDFQPSQTKANYCVRNMELYLVLTPKRWLWYVALWDWFMDGPYHGPTTKDSLR